MRPSDRIFVCGRSGSGKSALAKALFLASPARRRLVVDPTDSPLTQVPGAADWRDPARPPADAATLRFVPDDPGDLDAYDAVYRWAFDHGPIWIWADEAGDIAPAKATKPGVRRVLSQGRKWGIGHLGCHTRPVEVNKGMVANADHVVTFDLPNPEDRRHVADACGIPPRDFDGYLAELPKYGFVWYAREHHRLLICQPLKL